MASDKEHPVQHPAQDERPEPFRFSIDLLPLANRLLGPAMTLAPTRGAARIDDGPNPCRPGSICWDDEDGMRTGSGGSGEIVLVVAVATALTGLFFYELLKQAIEISWQNFGRNMPGSDGDLITLSETPGGPGEMIVTLTIDPSINWWKAVEVYDGTGRLLGSAWCKRDEGVVENTTRIIEFQAPSYIVFKKAKALGVHTSMYVLRGVQSKFGRNLHFTWVAQD
jgi:hypothetical protein